MNPILGFLAPPTRRPFLQKRANGKLVLSDTTNEIVDALNTENGLPSFGGRERHSSAATILVKLEVAGGTEGTASTEPSWRYNIKDLDGSSIATNVTPVFQRRNGRHKFAKIGQWWPFWFDADHLDGALVSADEVQNTGPC
jgi:hypothetical protein